MNHRLAMLVEQTQGSGLRARIVRGVGGTFALRLVNAAIQFLTGLALARLLGKDGLGVYNFALSWVMLLTVPAIFGMDRLLVRELVRYRQREAWGHMRGALRFANRTTLLTALLLAAGIALLGWVTYQTTGRPALLKAQQAGLARAALHALWIAMILLPVWAVLLLQSSAMQGLRHVVVAQIPEQVVGPALFLLLIIASWLAGGLIDSPQGIVALELATTAIALMVSMTMLRGLLPSRVGAASPVFETRAWVLAAIPLAIGRGMITLNNQVDTLMLGAIAEVGAVGVFSVALAGTQMITMILLSVNTALAPNLAQLHAEGDRRRMQFVLTQAALFMLLAALPLTVFFVVWGKWFLALFGAEFKAGYAALVIVALGQHFSLASGSVGMVLMMTGHERAAMWGPAAGVALHIALNALLIPRWGIDGAAVGRASGIVFANVALIWIVWRRLGVHSTALGAIPHWIGVARRRASR